MKCPNCGEIMDEHQAKLEGVIAYDCAKCGYVSLGQRDLVDEPGIMANVACLLFCMGCILSLYFTVGRLF